MLSLFFPPDKLFSRKPSYAVNEAPVLHKYNVCFNLKSQKLFAALSNGYCWSGSVHCMSGGKQFFSPFVCSSRRGWKSHCLLFPLSSVVVQARRKHLQLQLLSQHDSVPCRTRRLVPVFETKCLSQIWLFLLPLCLIFICCCSSELH